MNLMEPVLFFDDSFALCGWVYHTSAVYDIFGIAIATYSCRIALADSPVDVRASRLTRLIQASADLAAFSVWAVHFNLGSNRTLRNRYVFTDLTVVDLFMRGWEIVSVDS